MGVVEGASVVVEGASVFVVLVAVTGAFAKIEAVSFTTDGVIPAALTAGGSAEWVAVFVLLCCFSWFECTVSNCAIKCIKGSN